MNQLPFYSHLIERNKARAELRRKILEAIPVGTYYADILAVLAEVMAQFTDHWYRADVENGDENRTQP